MKKGYVFLLTFLISIIYSSATMAEEREIEPTVEEGKISTLILLRDDWYSGGLHNQEGVFYWYGERFGAGVNVCTTPETDFAGVKPYLTWRIDKTPFVLVGGCYTTSPAGNDYVRYGTWIFPKFGRWKTFIDLSQYQAISSSDTSDYFDSLIEMVYPVTEKLDIGPVVIYDYWWQDDQHDWLLFGPVGYYHFNERIALFARPSFELIRNDGNSEWVKKFRLGLKFTF